jgi:hypothetical protein
MQMSHCGLIYKQIFIQMYAPEVNVIITICLNVGGKELNKMGNITRWDCKD